MEGAMKADEKGMALIFKGQSCGIPAPIPAATSQAPPYFDKQSVRSV